MKQQPSGQPADPSSPIRGRDWPSRAGTLLGVFAISLVARLVYLFQLRAAPFFPFYLGDARGYHEWAQRIAGGDWLGQEVFYQAPLYPYFLGSLYALFTDDLLFVRVCQAILGALGCALIADTSRRLFSAKAGLLAGLMLALYPPAVFFDGLIQKSVLDLLFLALALWLLATATESARKLPWYLAGVAIGGLVLCRENALVFVLVILAWLVLTSPRRGPRQLAFAALFVAGLTTILSPVVLRNRIVGDGFYLTTSQFGPNFYIGNNPSADGTYRPLLPDRGDVKYERRDATELAEKALGRELSPAEVSGYWVRRALAYITEQPSDWLALMLRKSWLVWNAIELEDTEDLHTYVEWSPPISRLTKVWHFGVLAPLAALGLCVTWRDRRKLSLLYWMTAAYAGSVAAFYVFARYRYPLVPFLVLFAAGGLSQGISFLRSGSHRAVAVCGVVGLAVAVVSNWPTGFEGSLGAATRYSIGNHLRRSGRADEAERYYRQAFEINPNMARAHIELGKLRRSSGRAGEAIHHLRVGIALQARKGIEVDAVVHHELGLAYLEQRQPRRARREFEIATRKDPLWPGPVNASAWLLATDPDPSVREPEEALRLAKQANLLTKGRDPSVLDTLAAAHAAAGLFEQAQETARQALERVDPSGAPSLYEGIRRRLELYERSQPFVQSAQEAAPWIQPGPEVPR